VTVLAGLPEILSPVPGLGGLVLEEACTVMPKLGSTAEVSPSYTAMTTSAYLPTLAAVGVPESRPVLLLKLAQAGLLATANESVRPVLVSCVVGVKL
jgi:hypothetical protein